MQQISIDSTLAALLPNFRIACLYAEVSVENSSRELKEFTQGVCEARTLPAEEISFLPEIAAGRRAYSALGKSPTRYRLSSEALLRRLSLGKGLYEINNVVDINNCISIRSGLSLGAYDYSKLSGAIVLVKGKPGETYTGIGKGSLNLENLPILRDDFGYFGSPTSDSERAMIRAETKKILLCLFDFSGKSSLKEHTELAAELLTKYAAGNHIEYRTD